MERSSISSQRTLLSWRIDWDVEKSSADDTCLFWPTSWNNSTVNWSVKTRDDQSNICREISQLQWSLRYNPLLQIGFSRINLKDVAWWIFPSNVKYWKKFFQSQQHREIMFHSMELFHEALVEISLIENKACKWCVMWLKCSKIRLE